MGTKTPVCGLLFAALALPLAAQAPQGLPSERGIYYRADSGWVALPGTPLIGLLDGGVARQLLGFGSRGTNAPLPGPHSLLRIENAKPTLYARGFSPLSGLYLVRADVRQDHRVIPGRVNRIFREGPVLRPNRVYPLDATAAAPGVVGLTPRNNLPPGEYAILAPPEPGYSWIRFGFSFGISTNTGGR